MQLLAGDIPSRRVPPGHLRAWQDAYVVWAEARQRRQLLCWVV